MDISNATDVPCYLLERVRNYFNFMQFVLVIFSYSSRIIRDIFGRIDITFFNVIFFNSDVCEEIGLTFLKRINLIFPQDYFQLSCGINKYSLLLGKDLILLGVDFFMADKWQTLALMVTNCSVIASLMVLSEETLSVVMITGLKCSSSVRVVLDTLLSLCRMMSCAFDSRLTS